jgi:hypothetical protein
MSLWLAGWRWIVRPYSPPSGTFGGFFGGFTKIDLTKNG